MNLTHLSLFTGIGGIDLAAEWAGFKTVGQCEWADYPTKVLKKHWPDVPRWRDIRTLTKEDFYARTGHRTVDLISGGFPCQPFSVAGNQKGKDDERYLWPEMLRVIRELTPRWVIGENVPGILHIAASDVVKDLERLGYHVVVFAFEAAAVGARHRRERIFFVGNAEHNGHFAEQKLRSDEAASDKRWQKEPKASGQSTRADRPADVSGIQGCECGSEVVADTDNAGNGTSRNGDDGNRQTSYEGWIKQSFVGVSGCCQTLANSNGRRFRKREPETEQDIWACCGGERGEARNQWSVEPNVGRVAHGVPARVDRLKCLGNAVVPQQAYPIFKAIAELEEVNHE